MFTSSKFKKSFFVVAFILLTACGGSSGSGAGEEPPVATPNPTPTDPNPTPTPPPTSVVAIGDSIGTGFGIATPWPTLLSRRLGAPVDNNSISGEQTSFGARIVGPRLDAVQPTHLVVLLGTNDAIRGSVSNAIANLQSIVNQANQRGVTVIVGTLPPITRSSSENARASQISAGIRGLTGARIADVRAAMGEGRNSISSDGVHPNQTGQQIIAAEFEGQF